MIIGYEHQGVVSLGMKKGRLATAKGDGSIFSASC
jgi:hypothetical protein